MCNSQCKSLFNCICGTSYSSLSARGTEADTSYYSVKDFMCVLRGET